MNTLAVEKRLLDTIRTLPHQRIVQVIDFARWLQTQPVETTQATVAELEAEDSAWEMSYMQNRDAFRAMAQEAIAEADAGKTLDMVIKNGRIHPQ